MMLNLENEPLPLREAAVEAGQLYLSQKGMYWLVIAVNGNGASIVVYDRSGLPQSVQRYAVSYLREKTLVGRAELPTLDIEWII